MRLLSKDFVLGDSRPTFFKSSKVSRGFERAGLRFCSEALWLGIF